jgi:hypothetical protein
MDHALIAVRAVEPSDLLRAWMRAERDCGRALNAWCAAKSWGLALLRMPPNATHLITRRRPLRPLAAGVRGVVR